MKCFCSCEKRRIITKPPLSEHKYICDALRDLATFFTIQKNVKKTHGGVLLLVKLQAFSLKVILHGCLSRF